MTDLHRKAFGGLLRLFGIVAAILFLPSWTLNYWQAWIFLAIFFGAALAISLYLMKNDPMLLERRLKAGPDAEKETSQKIIQAIAAAVFLAAIAVPAIDHRFAWSSVPLAAVAAGDVLVALGMFIVFFVFKANSFTSAIIEVDSGQNVVSTGPYALVRHPLYIGALVMLLGLPLALGSWWGLLVLVPMTLVIVWRLLEEEKFLAKRLPGYSQYCDRVRYRLVPFVW